MRFHNTETLAWPYLHAERQTFQIIPYQHLWVNPGLLLRNLYAKRLVSAFPALVSVVGMHFMYVLTKDRRLRKPVGLLE